MAQSGQVCSLVLKLIFYLAFGLAIPIACIVIGSKYDGQCPVQPHIATYLYVSGAFCAARGIHGLFFTIAVICGCCNSDKGLCISVVIDAILGIFLFAWFIAGSVWVYKLKDNFSDEPNDPDYCNGKLYNFAFGILTAQWVLNALSTVLTFAARCCGGK